MKKFLVYATVACALSFSACTPEEEQREDISSAPFVSVRACAAQDVLDQQLASDPHLHIKMQEIEEHTMRAIENGDLLRLVNGKIEIPVIVNVIYKTAAENISLAQIQSQIDVLNEDFNKTNADASNVPSLFSGVAADVDISFVLEKVNRKSSTKRSWSTNDDMKKSSKGGIDPTTPATHLNMWVVNKMTSGGSTILGYAQFPGGPAATDGVVMGYNFFGRTGVVSAPYNLGRTATHEVGHYLNLRHIWGDATCGNDQVSDTPSHNTANYGCPTYPHYSTCTGAPVEQTMNYMDYTDDPCMYMFTTGQKSRMLAIFASGGARASMAL